MFMLLKGAVESFVGYAMQKYTLDLWISVWSVKKELLEPITELQDCNWNIKQIIKDKGEMYMASRANKGEQIFVINNN